MDDIIDCGITLLSNRLSEKKQVNNITYFFSHKLLLFKYSYYIGPISKMYVLPYLVALLSIIPTVLSAHVELDDSDKSSGENTFEFKHHTYDDLTAVLNDVHQRCPDITYLYNLTGDPETTWEGRHLNVIVFSDHPEEHELGK